MRVNITQNRSRKKVLHFGTYHQIVFRTGLASHPFRGSILHHRETILCVSVGEGCV